VRIPVKSQYGPTLASLLAPWWRSAPRAVRGGALVLGGAVLVLAVGAVLTLLNSRYTHAAEPAFHFSYRSLDRVKPEAGGYVRVQSRGAGGALKYSFAVNPLELPPYRGALGAEIPIYASEAIRALRKRYPDLMLRGEGRSRLSSTTLHSLAGYQIAYDATVEGRPMRAREMLLFPETRDVRRGVDIVMLTAPGAEAQTTSPVEVGIAGVLQRPLTSFAFG
jgi:hypothetical protein